MGGGVVRMGPSRGFAPSRPVSPGPGPNARMGPFRSGPAPTRSFGARPFGSGAFRTGPFGAGFGNRFGRPGPLAGGGRFRHRPFGYYRPFYYPPYFPYSSSFLGPFSYVGFPDDYASSQEASNQEGANYAPEQDTSLADQVGALTNEVEELRAGQAGDYSRPGPSGAGGATEARPEEKTVPTVFAYRDGHQFEAQNYALVGQTLWVFGDETTHKIALAELDLSATKKLNDQRGVDFTLPEAR